MIGTPYPHCSAGEGKQGFLRFFYPAGPHPKLCNRLPPHRRPTFRRSAASIRCTRRTRPRRSFWPPAVSVYPPRPRPARSLSPGSPAPPGPRCRPPWGTHLKSNACPRIRLPRPPAVAYAPDSRRTTVPGPRSGFLAVSFSFPGCRALCCISARLRHPKEERRSGVGKSLWICA